jgi:maltooligosyltrehalose trehalohydrolase
MRSDQLLGASPSPNGVRFKVWAPEARSVEVVVFQPRGERGGRTGSGDGDLVAIARLTRSDDGYFSGIAEQLRPGALYQYRVDGKGPYPDPASRFQPEGPHGPSQVVDPASYAWNDREWPGVVMDGQVIYELHVGAFTPEGTFDAAAEQLSELAALGVTTLELMPVAEFPGRWNWGYDGVDLFAPYHGYGDHDALKRFVDRAHAVGLAVILDVVYNHLGPDGNYLECFSPAYFTDRYPNDWGKALNFDGPESAQVREFFIENACYWIREFHLDGLRLDATQSIHDDSATHVLAELSQRTRKAALPRSIILVAENEPQEAECLRPPEEDGFGLDAMWNDDFHHSARVALCGTHDGYFHDHRGRPQEFISAVKRGFLFQGQYYHWQKKPRGTPITDQPAAALVCFIQNHDQVGNTLDGIRIGHLTSPSRLRAMTALLLLGPETPLLFMGQEFGASTPFRFFADHKPALSAKVFQGRREFLKQFAGYATPDAQARIQDPSAEATFRGSILDFAEREKHAPLYALHRDLIALRKRDRVISRQVRQDIDGAVLGNDAFVLRWFGGADGDRLLVVNLRDELDLHPAPEPLLAPPFGSSWQLVMSTEDPSYGGIGCIVPRADTGWRLSAECAVLLKSI